MLEENLRDAGEILQNILSQPLSIPTARKDASLLTAAQDFRPSEHMTSDLRKILIEFLQYPEQRNLMLRELELLAEDLQ